jgi:hypothetical protein
MVSLVDLQEYCQGKRIIIVGNSSQMIGSNSRNIIDSYDIVVRINKGYQYRRTALSSSIGFNTHILAIGMKSAQLASTVIKSNSIDYILSPIIHSEILDYPNVYNVDNETYNLLKTSLGNYKPSTGISVYNFFNRFINFERLDLIGFDFFTSSTNQRNALGHLFVKDHNGEKEEEFFKGSKDPEKTKLYELKSTTRNPIANIPMYSKLSHAGLHYIKKVKAK